jgi:hypothetical protein
VSPKEHAAVSLVLAAAVGAATGRLDDPALYVAAVVGGEVIDVLDHTAYHLLYRRSHPDVAAGRGHLLAGRFRSALATYTDAENNRRFSGMALHNFLALSVLGAVTLAATFVLGGPYWLWLGAATFLLHMLSDVYRDIGAVGHVGNWLWLVRKDRSQDEVVYAALLAVSIALLGVGAAAAHAVALANGANNTRMQALTLGPLVVVGLGVLYIGCTRLLWLKHRRFLAQEIDTARQRWPRNRQELQSEQVLTTAATGAVIFVSTMAIQIAEPPRAVALLFLAPVIIAVFVSVFVHSTPAEVGALVGVASALVFMGAAHDVVDVGASWQSAYALVAGAGFAWIAGILGSALLRGRIVMSRALAVIDFQTAPVSSSDLGNAIVGALKGGCNAAQGLLESPHGSPHVGSNAVPVLVLPSEGGVLLTDGFRDFSCASTLRPILRELRFLVVHATPHADPTRPLASLPALGRTVIRRADRTKDVEARDAYWVFGESTALFGAELHRAKRPSEILDNLNTRFSHLHVAVEWRSLEPDLHRLTIRAAERTSTKEYSSPEAELAAACVVKELNRRLESRATRIVATHAGRVTFPPVDIYFVPASQSIMEAHPSPPGTLSLQPFSPGEESVQTEYGLGRRVVAFTSEVAIALAIATVSAQNGLSDLLQ